jgi:hypothetical protein
LGGKFYLISGGVGRLYSLLVCIGLSEDGFLLPGFILTGQGIFFRVYAMDSNEFEELLKTAI